MHEAKKINKPTHLDEAKFPSLFCEFLPCSKVNHFERGTLLQITAEKEAFVTLFIKPSDATVLVTCLA
jgi:hypothetical protein